MSILPTQSGDDKGAGLKSDQPAMYYALVGYLDQGIEQQTRDYGYSPETEEKRRVRADVYRELRACLETLTVEEG